MMQLIHIMLLKCSIIMLLYIVCKSMNIHGYTNIRPVLIWSAMHTHGYFCGTGHGEVDGFGFRSSFSISIQTYSIAWRYGGANYILGKGYADPSPEDGPAVEGGDGFGSDGMRRLPWVC
jgi:hypothetical protein